jgi:hypothetical protein
VSAVGYFQLSHAVLLCLPLGRLSCETGRLLPAGEQAYGLPQVVRDFVKAETGRSRLGPYQVEAAGQYFQVPGRFA